MRLRELQISYRTVTHTPAGQRPQIVTAKDAVGVVAPLLAGKIVEHFGVLSLDTREVFLIAILHHAAALIVVHNHPSGDPSPSPDDITLSRRLRQCGQLLGIGVLDSLVLADGGLFISLREAGELEAV